MTGRPAKDTVESIKTLYYDTTKQTVQRDLTRAIEIFKTLESEEDRERAAVYMDGLSQMRSEWGVRPNSRPAGRKQRR